MFLNLPAEHWFSYVARGSIYFVECRLGSQAALLPAIVVGQKSGEMARALSMGLCNSYSWVGWRYAAHHLKAWSRPRTEVVTDRPDAAEEGARWKVKLRAAPAACPEGTLAVRTHMRAGLSDEAIRSEGRC